MGQTKNLGVERNLADTKKIACNKMNNSLHVIGHPFVCDLSDLFCLVAGVSINGFASSVLIVTFSAYFC